MEGSSYLSSSFNSVLHLELQDFDRIIKAHFPENRRGSCFVWQGDYYISRADDHQLVHRSEIGNVLKVGMVLEMNIVLRSARRLGMDGGDCPRCHYANHTAPIGQWVEW